MSNSHISPEDTERLIINSLMCVISYDDHLLKAGLHEDCINHRLAIYLKAILSDMGHPEYDVDVEYNRNLIDMKKNVKHGSDENSRIDIIIHKRGVHTKNYLAIEAKKEDPLSGDVDKIIGLVEQWPYNYDYGCLISYNKRYYKFVQQICDVNKEPKPF